MRSRDRKLARKTRWSLREGCITEKLKGERVVGSSWGGNLGGDTGMMGGESALDVGQAKIRRHRAPFMVGNLIRDLRRERRALWELVRGGNGIILRWGWETSYIIRIALC